MVDLRGKTAVVTGASSGIGAALMEALMDEDVDVFPLDRAHGTDISSYDEVSRFVRKLPAVDILINNVGVSPTNAALWNPEMLWPIMEQAFKVSFLGPLYLTRELLVHCRLIPKRDGMVYNVLSNNLRFHPAEYMTYNCAKAALQEMSYTLAAEIGPLGGRVGSLVLGCVNTPGFKLAKQYDPSLKDLRTLKSETVAAYIIRTLQLMEFASSSPWTFNLDYE